MTKTVELKGVVSDAAEHAIEAIEAASKKAIKKAEKTAVKAEKALASQAKAAEKALVRRSPSTKWVIGAIVGVTIIGAVLAMRRQKAQKAAV
ncbi:MAG: hypothetical protein OEO77_02760 [Acidimicrobiia bacterium]|nr:hypothetical protein [Acidimicrobiia bacterium]